MRMTVGVAAQTIYNGLLEKPAGGDGVIAAELEQLVNRNGDTEICLLTRWGDHLNEKSHWHRVGMEVLGEPTTLFLATDNNANAGK